MTLFRTVDPAVEPLTLAEVRAYLRLGDGGEDDFIAQLIAAARQEVERLTGSALIDQHWRLVLDDWPPDGPVLLRRPPVREVISVTIYGPDGAAALLPSSAWAADTVSEPARILLFERPRPGVPINGIEIDFRAGHGATGVEVPDRIRRAVLTLVAHWYEFRGQVPACGQPVSYPAGFAPLAALTHAPRLL